MKILVTALLAALISLSVSAQTADMRTKPGYVDLGTLDAIYGEPRVMINLGGSLLKLMAMASKEDPEAAQMIKGLDGIRINVYPTQGNLAPAIAQLEKVKSLLQADDWEPVVQVNESDEQVQIFMKTENDVMQGLAVMAVNDEEAVFLNILGEIDPAKVGAVMNQLNVDVDVDQE